MKIIDNPYIRYTKSPGGSFTGADTLETDINKMFTFTANFIGTNKNTSGIVGCALSHYTLWKKYCKLTK